MFGAREEAFGRSKYSPKRTKVFCFFSSEKKCLSFLLMFAFAGGVAQASAPTVTITQGSLTGLTENGAVQYLGIPYAAPPIGALRWRPPAAAPSFGGTLQAQSYGPACPQMFAGTTSESCLFLNVTAPVGVTNTSNLPVMVWIHGGGFISGTGADFDPTQLALRGQVVVVTINYRLGYLGFLAHPALSAADPNHVSGNYGLLDQQAALAWVRTNIHAFGGNPQRITIFGESAGGQSVADQLISPSVGPIAGAILQSGAYQTTLPTLAAEQIVGETAATNLGCASQTAACLYALSATTLGNALNPLSSLGGVSAVVDGRTIPLSPAAAFDGGAFAHVPVINGGNHDEYRLFIGLDQFFGAPAITAAAYTAENSAATLAVYPLSNYVIPDYAQAAVTTDEVFSCNTHLFSALMAQYTNVYQYELNDPNAPVESGPKIAGFSYGSAHSADLSYFFPNYTVFYGPAVFTPQQTQLVGAMQDYWTSFARYGRPISRQGAAWPGYSLNTGYVQEFIPPSARAQNSFFAGHHCDYWKSSVLSTAGLASTAPY